MSFKRARAGELSGADSFSTACEDAPSIVEAGAKFRRLLIQKYLDGTASAADTCQLAFWHLESGGQGAEDLAFNPRTASRHSAEHLRLGVENVCVEPKRMQ